MFNLSDISVSFLNTVLPTRAVSQRNTVPRGQRFLLIERANVPLVQTKDNIPATFTESPGSGPSKRSRMPPLYISFNFHGGTFGPPMLQTIALSRAARQLPRAKADRGARSFGRNFYGKFRSLDMFTRHHARPPVDIERGRRRKRRETARVHRIQTWSARALQREFGLPFNRVHT